MSKRYVAVAVDVFDHHFFEGDAKSRREAWLWLIAHATWKDHRVNNNGEEVVLHRGEIIVARPQLAAEWGWTEKAVRCFLERLEAEKMIEIGGRLKGRSKGRFANIATICNYEKYQTVTHKQGPVEGPVEGPQQYPTQQKDKSSTSSGTAREGLNNFVLGGVGIVREPSASAKAAVCQALNITNAEPLASAYRAWKPARRARDPDAMFRRAAAKIFARLPPDDRERCQPIAVEMPSITVRPVQPSSALLASLTKGRRFDA